MVNAVSMDNVEHAYAVQQLRKSGKIAKIVSININNSYIYAYKITCMVFRHVSYARLLARRNTDEWRGMTDLCEVTGCQIDFKSHFGSDNQTEEEGACPHGSSRGEGNNVRA